MVLFEEDFEEIFSTMMGERQLCGGVPWVKNGFQGETGISGAYRDFETARKHLCGRFGLEWEDVDLERFMNGILVLEKEVALRMFLYGIGYAQRGCRL